jgi:hypothetical protein
MMTMDTSLLVIQTWLLLDDCRLPPRVFVIINELLKVIEQQDQILATCRQERRAYDEHA